MRFGPTVKTLLGVATVWPIIYILGFIATIGYASQGHAAGLGWLFPVLALLHVGTIFLIFGLTAVYAIHTAKNEALEPNERILWMVLIVVFNVFVAPIYYVMHVLRAPPPIEEVA